MILIFGIGGVVAWLLGLLLYYRHRRTYWSLACYVVASWCGIAALALAVRLD